MDSAEVIVGNSKGTDLSGPVFSQEITPSFIEYFGLSNYNYLKMCRPSGGKIRPVNLIKRSKFFFQF